MTRIERLREALACETCRRYRNAALVVLALLMIAWAFA